MYSNSTAPPIVAVKIQCLFFLFRAFDGVDAFSWL